MEKSKKINKLWAGWLLVVLLTVPFAIKSAHTGYHSGFFNISDISTTDTRHEHDCDNCPVCHFYVSLFSQPDELKIQIFSIIPRDIPHI